MKKKIIVSYIGDDNMGKPVYKSNNNRLYKDVNLGEGTPDLYSCDNKIDGDPCFSVSNKYDIIYESKKVIHPQRYEYMMLSRLQSDCEYFTNYGKCMLNRKTESDIYSLIEEMRDIYNSLEDKPEWLSLEDINKYEAEMLEIKKETK